MSGNGASQVTCFREPASGGQALRLRTDKDMLGWWRGPKLGAAGAIRTAYTLFDLEMR
jgi:hypothetical protein